MKRIRRIGLESRATSCGPVRFRPRHKERITKAEIPIITLVPMPQSTSDRTGRPAVGSPPLLTMRRIPTLVVKFLGVVNIQIPHRRPYSSSPYSSSAYAPSTSPNSSSPVSSFTAAPDNAGTATVFDESRSSSVIIKFQHTGTCADVVIIVIQTSQFEFTVISVIRFRDFKLRCHRR